MQDKRNCYILQVLLTGLMQNALCRSVEIARLIWWVFFFAYIWLSTSVGSEPSKRVLIGALLFFIFIFSFGIIKLKTPLHCRGFFCV